MAIKFQHGYLTSSRTAVQSNSSGICKIFLSCASRAAPTWWTSFVFRFATFLKKRPRSDASRLAGSDGSLLSSRGKQLNRSSQGLLIYQPVCHVLVQYAGNESLIRYAFLQRPFLQFRKNCLRNSYVDVSRLSYPAQNTLYPAKFFPRHRAVRFRTSFYLTFIFVERSFHGSLSSIYDGIFCLDTLSSARCYLIHQG